MASRRLVVARGLALVFASTLGSCRSDGASASGAPGGAAADARNGWHYVMSPDASLESAGMQVCFDGLPPDMLIPGVSVALPFAREFRDDDGNTLEVGEDGVSLAGLGPGACVHYRVDFAGLLQAEGTGRMIGDAGDSLMARPGLWLWRPYPLAKDPEVTLRFDLPEGMEVSTPWPTRGEAPRGTPDATYELDRTAFNWLSFIVFGALTVDRFERAGVEIELTTLDAPVACPPEGLRTWVTDAVDSVAMLFGGRFPRDRLQLVINPVSGGGSGTVYFGLAGRGGGPGVFIFLDDEAEAAKLPGGWTTVHELLHHGMPFIREPWMAEGWVSYYTELMRTRMGHRTELEGWQALFDAFERGRRRGGETTLAESSAAMRRVGAYQRVYWGGASVAFLIDVQLRLDSGGERGLDDAMVELRRCCGDATFRWDASELLQRLDTWHGEPLFTRVAEEVLAGNQLPDVEAAMARLGVQVNDGEVSLDDQHPAAAARRAIMAPPR
ncbi:MAG: hypothetical protein AAF799_34945 [Myxococcota bacterium]